MSRFVISSGLEKEIFYRYFRIPKEEKTVICIDNYDNKEAIINFDMAARACPKAKFFFFGPSKSFIFLDKETKKLLKHAPDNLFYKDIVPDDIYVSMMINADVLYISDPNSCDQVLVLEAMAAKTQIIGVGPLRFYSQLKNKKNSYIGNGNKETIEILYNYLDGKLPSLTKDAFQLAQTNSLLNIGKALNKAYEGLINDKKQVKEND